MIDRFASLPHYAAHVDPVWQALPPDARGTSYATRHTSWGAPIPRGAPVRPTIVASYVDARRMSPRPCVLVEHGAGQSYPGDPTSATHGSYAGGDGLDHIILFVAPGEHVAARWRARYPNTPVVVVGSPRVDELARTATRCQPVGNTLHRPTVAVTWHWDCELIPETRSALRHYRDHLPRTIAALRSVGVDVVGHGHPRAWRQMRPMWGRLGVEPVESFADVVARATVLAVDNTSAGPEWAALDRPVVWMNAPWYRRDVEHGGRFWQWPRGQVSCNHPTDLAVAILAAFDDPPPVRAARASMVAGIYGGIDGHAAERAATAIMEALCRTPTRPEAPSA